MSSTIYCRLGPTLSLSSCFPERLSYPSSAFGSEGTTSTAVDGSRVTLHSTSNVMQEIKLAIDDLRENAVSNEGPVRATITNDKVHQQSTSVSPTNVSVPMQHRSIPGSKPAKSLATYVPLYQAALKGDWEKAKSFIIMNPQAPTTRISKGWETALHIAAGAKQTKFVKELVKLMDKRDLELKNKYDNTALCFAAASGVTMIAEVMVKKNRNLPGIRGSNGVTPLHMAALLGHRDMVWFLYNVTNDFLTIQDYTALLIATISSDLFDVALRILQQQPNLATERDSDGETALHVLARKPSAFSGKKLINTQALDLLKCLWQQYLLLDDSEIGDRLRSPSRPLFVAAECGNFEFISELLHTYPDLFWKVDEESRSIFHVAVMHRQERIFKLIYDIGAHKDLIASYTDENNRNILHLAGRLAPFNRLNIVSGAALQMQLELLWFKEVEKNVQPLYKEMRDIEGRTPRMLFTEEHKGLVTGGERWMKDTATSCMLLATLITTVMFAAIFTVPGGNSSDNGTPIFLKHKSFSTFAISDALALFSSVTSILMFLSILTSRYAEEDFLETLPKRLIIGLTTLFFSIVSMLVAFSASFCIVIGHHSAWIAIPVALTACIPITLFALLQFPLLYDMVLSTYGSGIFHRESKEMLY